MLIRLFFGLTIMGTGVFGSFQGEDIQIHKTNDSILIKGEEISCLQCNSLVLGHRLDINQATAQELQGLPRIGEKKSQLIIALREKKQGFQSIQELDEVKGIGAKTVALLEPYTRVQ